MLYPKSGGRKAANGNIHRPDRSSLGGIVRQDKGLEAIESVKGHTPRSKVRFGLGEDGKLEMVSVLMIKPDDQLFEAYEQIAGRAKPERIRAGAAEQKTPQAVEQLRVRKRKLNG